MKAAVLSIGTELTRGELLDTNAGTLADRLTALGFEIVRMQTVDDEVSRIVSVLRELARSDVSVVVSTGGLGPTSDDLTAAAVAEAFAAPLERDEASLAHIKRLFASFGREMPTNNEKQADFPRGSTILPNSRGTAPGFSIEREGTTFFFMPGVPREMEAIFQDSIVRALGPKVRPVGHQIRLRTFGLTESELAARVQALDAESMGITLGYRASFPEIELKIWARGDDPSDCEERARVMARRAREVLGEAVYGDDTTSYAAAVGELLRRRGLTLSVAESCTGGLLSAMLTDAPGSSDFLLGGAVVYANRAKTEMLGVSQEILRAHGAVSAETAHAMAEGARAIVDADLAVSITGIAGPGGGSDDKPVGTVHFGLAMRGRKTVSTHRKLRGDRERIRTLAAYVALRMIKRAADGEDPTGL
jgi:nicotinamide-nucleotide amidase